VLILQLECKRAVLAYIPKMQRYVSCIVVWPSHIVTHGGSTVIAHRPSDRPTSGTSWIIASI